jgi:hypothetical protein
MNEKIKVGASNVVHRHKESIYFFIKLLNTFGKITAKVFLKAAEMEQ